MPKPTKPQFVCAVKNRRSGGVLIPGVVGDSPIQNFVWGDSWSWTSPLVEGATFYVPTGLPTGVSSTGFFDNNLGGVPTTAAALGATPVSIQGYDELFETPIGASVEYPDLFTLCRIYYGECDELPAEFTRADILALLNGDAATGPRELLVTTGRDVELEFPATSTAKYRVIAVPAAVWSFYATKAAADVGVVTFNRIRYADNTAPTFVPGPTTGTFGTSLSDECNAYTGFPYSDNTPYLDPAESVVAGYVFAIEATNSAFSVFLRCLVEDYQQNVIYGPTNTRPSWTYSGTVNKVPNLLSLRVFSSLTYNGAIWAENLDASGHTITASAPVTGTIDVSTGLSIPKAVTNTPTIPSLTGFDGVFDYRGSSGYRQVDVSLGDNATVTYTDAGVLGPFTGTGTATIDLAVSIGLTSSGSPSMSVVHMSSSVTQMGVLLFFTYYAGPTADIVTQPQSTSTLSRVTPSVDILDGTTPAPRATRLVPELFTCFVKPPDYVPTARAVVVSGFKPALVCAVRERVTPQPRPPYLPPPPEPTTPANFVWGDSWSWTTPTVTDAVYYLPTGLPAGIAATGFFNNSYAGTPTTSAPLGSTPWSVQGYNELLDTPVGDPISYPLATTKFRIYYGDSDTLPLPDDVTDSFLASLSLSSRLVTTARNQEITFAATTTPKYRFIVIPQAVVNEADLTYNINRIRNPDHSEANLVAGTYTPGDPVGYVGYPYSDVDPVLGTGASLTHYVFVVDATASAFSVFLRYATTLEQVFLGPSTPADPMTYSSTCNQLSSSLTMWKVNVQASTTYAGASWVENLDPSGQTISRVVTVDYTMSVGSITKTRQTVNTIAPLGFSGWDGNTDYLGSSGDQSTPTTISSGTSSTNHTSGPDFTQFSGSGTLPVVFSSSTVHTVTGTPSYSEQHPQTLQGLLRVTYYYYAN